MGERSGRYYPVGRPGHRPVAKHRRSRNHPCHFIFPARSLAPAGKTGRISLNPAPGRPGSTCASSDEPGAAIPHAGIREGAPGDRRPYLNRFKGTKKLLR